MYEDSQGAIGEAQKLVMALETEAANGTSGFHPLRTPFWAEKKSIEELWADVWAEVRS